jgi:hypothetical protein
MKTPKDVYYRHLRQREMPFLAREATIAALVTEEGMVQVGISICNPTDHAYNAVSKNGNKIIVRRKDQFSRAVGRSIAEGRANFNPYIKFPIPANTSELEACRLAVSSMVGLYVANQEGVVKRLANADVVAEEIEKK